jgi:hypothetical protein
MTTSKEAVAALIEVMNTKIGVPTGLKVSAAEGLGYAGGDEARAALLKVMTTKLGIPTELKNAAAKALGQASKG